MRTLLVEDYVPLASTIAGGLERAGFAVDVTPTIADAKEAVVLAEYDLAILDLGLPDGSGLDLMIEWRKLNKFPMIIMTARGALGDRLAGLDSGADDYIVKPVEIPELVARCRAILRRPGNRESIGLKAGNIALDTSSREVVCDGTVIVFGRRETALLEELLRRKNRVVPRSNLLEHIYDRNSEVTPNAVDAAVSRLRRNLDDANAGVSIKTVRGVGWILSE